MLFFNFNQQGLPCSNTTRSININEINVSSIIVRSKLPDSDFVVNPYVGCSHGCKYCYARFMRRFTGRAELWGDFVDVKINASSLVPIHATENYQDKIITIGSVTDPYQPLEKQYEITKKIIQKLIPWNSCLCVMTKSDLVTRDIELFKQFKNCTVVISLSILDDDIRKMVEPFSSKVIERIDALYKLHQAGIKTALFISPIFPYITDWKALIQKTQLFVSEYWFENLNLYTSIKADIETFIHQLGGDELIEKFRATYDPKSTYWKDVELAITDYCQQNKLSYKVYFHHQRRQILKRKRLNSNLTSKRKKLT